MICICQLRVSWLGYSFKTARKDKQFWGIKGWRNEKPLTDYRQLGACCLVIRLGFEPKTHSLEGCCSIQLSYQTITLAAAKILLFFKCGYVFAKKMAKTYSCPSFLGI